MIPHHLKSVLSNGERRALHTWLRLWEDLIHYADRPHFGLRLESPRITVRALFEEISDTSLQKKRNRALLMKQVDRWLGHQAHLGTHLHVHFRLMRVALDKPDDISYILSLCSRAQVDIDRGVLFRSNHNIIARILLDDPDRIESNVESLETASTILVIEFLGKGYSLNTIKKFPRNILSSYQIFDGLAFSEFPHKVDLKLFKKDDGSFDFSRYNEHLQGELDALSLRDRILALARYQSEGNEELIYLFPVRGLVGEADLTIGGTHFYSPVTFQYLKDPFRTDGKSLELFHRDPSRRPMNAAVRILGVDSGYDRIRAGLTVQGAMDVLHFSLPSKAQLRVDTKNYIAARLDGQQAGMSFSMDEETRNELIDALDLAKVLPTQLETIDRVSQQLGEEDPRDTASNTFVSVLRWMHKASRELEDEDAFLNLWIALELLLSISIASTGDESDTVSTILERLPYVIVNNEIVRMGWALYDYMLQETSTYIIDSEGRRPKVFIPQELIEKAQLQPASGDRIELSKFLSALSEIRDKTDDIVMKRHVQEIYGFYSDNLKARRRLVGALESVRNEIGLLYRYRNKIVHKGYHEKEFISFYRTRLESIVRVAVGALMAANVGSSSDNKQQYLAAVKANVDILMEELRSEEHVDILRYSSGEDG